jgi:hypothetical protein
MGTLSAVGEKVSEEIKLDTLLALPTKARILCLDSF